MLFGEYDLYLKLNCRDFGDLSGIVISRIRSIIGVDSTMTLTVAPTTK
jgi:DNA-binding Lrp family transcriptional regulator